MGVNSEVGTTIAESAVPSKKIRVKILAKKPFNNACEIPQPSLVNSLKNHPLTNGQSKAHIVERKLESKQGTKRKSEDVLEGSERKRLKMDRSSTLNCQTILSKLMHSKLAGPFLMPVDPDAWCGIDDYFDIIKNPMDLGTIQKKLNKKTYNYVEEFEADVRLTFSNAMLYNPPDNWVHKSAKELDMLFTRVWKVGKVRVEGEHKHIQSQVEMKQRGLVSSLDKTKHYMKIEHEKLKIDGERKDIKQEVDMKQKVFVSSNGKITYDGKVKCSVSRSSQAGQSPRKATTHKERGFDDLKKVSVGGQQPSDLNVVKPQDCKPKESSNKTPPTIGFLGATVQGLETMDVEVSPSKALRVARLKSRFADTILKAQHQTLLEPGSKTSSTTWEQEKLILERRQQEEKARIEAQIRAVESAARLKAESELKQKREALRQASRLAIEKMERSVDFEDNLHVLRDLEAMIGTSLVVVCHDRRSHSTVWSQLGTKNLSPLQRLGLYIKEEYMMGDDDDDDDDDLEEGEVVL